MELVINLYKFNLPPKVMTQWKGTDLGSDSDPLSSCMTLARLPRLSGLFSFLCCANNFICLLHLVFTRAFLVAQMVKNPPAMQETQVWSLDWEEMRAWQLIPVFLPGESPWTEEPGGLQSMGSQRVRHNWETNTCEHASNEDTKMLVESYFKQT